MTQSIQERRLAEMNSLSNKVTYISYLEQVYGNVALRHVPDIWLPWLAAIQHKFHETDQVERLGEVA